MKYHYRANSNAAPFFCDPSDGIVEADDAMWALEKVVKEYNHPCGLYSVIVMEPSLKGEKDGKTLTRYLSAKARKQLSESSPLLEKWEWVNIS